MRAIRFRAWYPEDKMMVMPNLIDAIGNVYEFKIDKEPKHIENAIIMQYTGLKDKNGRKIYEGDICKFFIKHYFPERIESWYPEIGEISWDSECGAWWPFADGEDNAPYPKAEDCEVIGNIYENSELVEVKK